MAKQVLLVDDDAHMRRFVARGLERVGYQVQATEDGDAAIRLLQEHSFDAVLCDLHVPKVDGLDLLRFAATLEPPPPFVMLTGYGSVSVAVDAMKHGAVDFLEKPVSVEQLRHTLEAITELGGTPRVKGKTAVSLVGSRHWLEPLIESVNRIAQANSSVLIQGERGTGKSSVAREIWRLSRRANGPFYEVRCNAVPGPLLERELFGHVEGALMGSTRVVPGKMEQADKGTLFLNGIEALEPELQAKLLQVLENGTCQPVGSPRPRAIDVRIIAAASQDLLGLTGFRRELYYRLNVASLRMVPLRDRPEDIPILVQHFLRRVAEKIGNELPTFSDEAMSALRSHLWPGNIRELESLVERMAVIVEPTKKIEPNHFIDALSESGGNAQCGTVVRMPNGKDLLEVGHGKSLSETVRAVEQSLIEAALERTGGNKSQAAKILHMKRTTLIEKLKKLQVDLVRRQGA